MDEAPVDFYQTPGWRFMRECVLAYWGDRCLKCGSSESMHVDHIVPRSKAPELEMDFNNLQTLCETCNMEKSNKTCEDYRNPARKNPTKDDVLSMLAIRRKRQYEPPRSFRHPKPARRVVMNAVDQLLHRYLEEKAQH